MTRIQSCRVRAGHWTFLSDGWSPDGADFWIEFTIWLNPRLLTIELLLDLTPKSDTQVSLKLFNFSIFTVLSDPMSPDTGVWTRFNRLPPPPLGFSLLMATLSLLTNEKPVLGLTDQSEAVTRTQSCGICSLITMRGGEAVRLEFCQESGHTV